MKLVPHHRLSSRFSIDLAESVITNRFVFLWGTGYAKVLTLFAFLILAVIILVPLCLIRRWKRKKQPKPSQQGISTSSSTASRCVLQYDGGFVLYEKPLL